MIRTKADMEGPIVRIKIQPVERGVRIDPMRDLERPNVRNAEIDTLTEARTERVSISVELAAGMLIPARGYISNRLARRR